VLDREGAGESLNGMGRRGENLLLVLGAMQLIARSESLERWGSHARLCAISKPVKGSQWDPLGQASLSSSIMKDQMIDESTLERCGTELNKGRPVSVPYLRKSAVFVKLQYDHVCKHVCFA
jgi:hypothetical protein